MRKSSTVILFLLVALSLVFIFGNSVLSKGRSNELSKRVYERIEDKVSPIWERLSGREFTHQLLRKTAHFAEFFLLGVIVFLASAFVREIPKRLCFLFFGLAVAFLDEGLQYFTGRGNSIKDVFLDWSGFCVGSLLSFAISEIFMCIGVFKSRSEKR